jgi:uncharacterized CHY-type Zn-finger protein
MGDYMDDEPKSCDISQEKVICPRCQHSFVPDTELDASADPKNKGEDELNVLTSCPLCGHNFRPRGSSH